MKTFIFGSALSVIGAAITVNAIVLPQNSHFNTYPQFGGGVKIGQDDHLSPRALDNDGGSIKIPMYRNSKRDFNNPEDTFAFAKAQLDYVQAKWGKTEEAKEKRRQQLERRQIIGISDFGQDSFYFAQLSVGTPKQNFNVILDTGSADFWLVDTDCTSSQCDGTALFNPSASSTYKGSSNPFQITYGTGAVKGTLSADTVSLAGYTVDDQTFAVATQLAPQSLQAPTSGIMGMGFQSLAQSRATPFWEVLVQQNKLKTNAFTFQMARNVRTASQTSISPGGVFTLGEIDPEQYSGNINYVNLSGQEGYWTIPLQALTVNGQTGNINGDGTSAIDTGTTLIIAPPNIADQIYSQIPGAGPISSGFSSSSQGMYAIPCSSNVNISLTFGGQQYSINSADMSAGILDSRGQNCLGGILGSNLGGGAPSFIVGDVFLKNVFSVYQYSPAAVGFASLKGQAAQTASTTSGAVQIGSNTAAPSSATSSAADGGGGLPPLFSSLSSGSGQSSLAAGAGLPSPSAAASVSASSPSLTPANGDNSNSAGSFTSSSTRLHSNQIVSVTALLLALVCGMMIAI